MQQWFGYFDPAMEEVRHDAPLLRGFAGPDAGGSRLPDETTRFRRLLERRHELATSLFDAVAALLAERGLLLRSGTIVDATLIATAPSTSNQLNSNLCRVSLTCLFRLPTGMAVLIYINDC